MKGKIRSYWFAPAPRRDLGLFRIIVVATNVVYLLGSGLLTRIDYLAGIDDGTYAPLPAVSAILYALGGGDRPSRALLHAVYWIAVGSGILAAAGAFTRTALLVFGVAYLTVSGYTYSFGEYHHPLGLALIVLLVLPFSPAGSVLSVDSFLASRQRVGGVRASQRRNHLVLWPLRLAQCLLALAYLSSARSKTMTGLDWINPYTLRFHLFNAGLPAGVYAAGFPQVVQALAVLTLIWEASFSVVLLAPRLAWLYLPFGLVAHLCIYLTFPGHNFAPFVSLYAAFIPAFLGPPSTEPTDSRSLSRPCPS